eukprot:scaffold524_cov390-Prasinococcus_capsulatus_cf.AAC.3
MGKILALTIMNSLALYRFFGVWAPVLRHVPLITVLGTSPSFQDGMASWGQWLRRRVPELVGDVAGNHDAKPGLGHSSCISGAGPYFDLFAKGGSPTLEHGGDKAHDSVPGARPMDIPPAALAAIRRQEGLLYYSVDVHPQCRSLRCIRVLLTGLHGRPLARFGSVAKQRSQWVIAILHHPPYTDGNYHSDSYTRLGDIRRMLLPWLEWANVDLVVSGHSHGYERSMLVAGHYGSSDTLRDHMIKSKGSTAQLPVYGTCCGDQHHNGSSSFYKKEVAFGGALYIVAGSGSKVDLRHGKHVGQLRHPVHMTGLSTLGGLRIDLSAGTMHIRFLGIDQKGANAVLDEVFVHKDSSVGNNAPPASDAAMAMLRVHSPDGMNGTDRKLDSPMESRVGRNTHSLDVQVRHYPWTPTFRTSMPGRGLRFT